MPATAAFAIAGSAMIAIIIFVPSSRFGSSFRIRDPHLCCVCVAAFSNLRLGLATMEHRPNLAEFIPLRANVAPRLQTEICTFCKRGDSVTPSQVATNASLGPASPVPFGPGHRSCQQMLHIAASRP
jgi:hypothetical protein